MSGGGEGTTVETNEEYTGPERCVVGSIIAENQEQLDERLAKIKDHVKKIHLDVMDGQFVENHSLDFDFKLPELKQELEAHLMVKDPEAWIDKHGDKVGTIIIHLESVHDVRPLIKKVKDMGKRVGVAMNPKTPLNHIAPTLTQLDQVLIMTVHPGRYGATFVPEAIQKVYALRGIHPNIDIEVDGAITPSTIEDASEAGANRFVSGSYLQKADDVGKAVKKLEELMKVKWDDG